MAESMEFSGKNVDEALQQASDELKIPLGKINHEVITYGSSGIFGLVGVKKARIKVFVPKKKRAPVPENEVRETTKQTSRKKMSPEKEADKDACETDPELVEYGREVLNRIVSGISEGADIEASQRRGKLLFTVSNGESGVLIGKRGQTLEAIQYLLEKTINKKSANRVRVLVDVEGYLEKRRNNLQQMALRMAEKAKRTKKPVTIGQMNSHDRRIVHIQLKDEEGVRTQSIGDGYYRKLMIFPKKQGGSRKSRKRSNDS